ncbi:nucleoside hydrolase, partial [uncultured Ramlibacter sp.]|uniref:nucleoside hydrolase n=1 Tax=uncultured Ramlibacter sp. TaxID=260755 RepID=UPI0026280804
MRPHHRIILDADPGIDDAMALYFTLAQPQLELLGITATFGNVSASQAARNAIYLCALAGRQIPVCEGVNTPTRNKPVRPAPEIQGADGLGDLPERLRLAYAPDERSAARFIVDQAHAHPGEVTLVALGPLTNLSLALRLEPRLPELLQQVIVVGGSISAPGNVSPVAESNAWHDPHAADHIFTAGFALTLLGLDVTQQMVLPVSVLERIAAQQPHPATETLLHAARFSALYQSTLEPERAPACYAHDLLGPMYLVQPELFTMASGRVRVVTEGLAEGQT